ncbi:MLO-like protein [Rhynchospora pubera]|uniref:MLO-like protein n=1 Tax=Rhynchospora pubera TaxID=906938 RepID=A0AAV8EAQ9_9POAL|nr:MLO-like protein [Rhynchospora pubera]
MGGGGGGGGGATSPIRELDQTPTWAVASVVLVIILISILIEKALHHLGQTFEKKKKRAMVEALEKVKGELMVLGFISLLLTFGQNYLIKICITDKMADTMLPCRLEQKTVEEEKEVPKEHEKFVLNSFMHLSSRFSHDRFLMEASPTPHCPVGKVSLISINAIHQLHIFIFFLAAFHVLYSAATMALGRAKIREWKEWEKGTVSLDYEFSNDPSRFRFTHETSFVRHHTSWWNSLRFSFYCACFFRQFFTAVRKYDYLAMRHGFITVHLAPGSKFDFQKYIKRSLEDDFKVVVGISPILWLSAVVFLLLNVKGLQTLNWMSILPLIIVLAVGTKLQAIIAQMALEIKERHAVVQGIPLVQLSDSHFWFSKPRFVLFLIHYTLFQNAFEIIHFVWIWYEFGLRSCFHEHFTFIIVRVCIGFLVQFICSYITLPLYALVSQMGSHMKRSIFDEQTSKALKKWHHQAVVKTKATGGNHNTNQKGSTSPSSSPRATSPPRPSEPKKMQRMQSKAADRGVQLQVAPSRRSHSYNEQEITDENQNEAAPATTMAPMTDLLTGSALPQQQGPQQQQRRGGDDEDYQFVRVDL